MISQQYEFELDIAYFREYLGPRLAKKLDDPEGRTVLEEIVEIFQALVNPSIVWDRFQIAVIEENNVLLRVETAIGNTTFVEAIRGAEEIVLAVCSVGGELERKAKELMSGGTMFSGILLDAAASWAVDDLRCRFYREMQNRLEADEQYRCSSYLSPGESFWGIEDQRVIFHLLGDELDECGLSLTESNMMVPFKSLSMAFGIGPNKMGSEGDNNCAVCTMRDTCRFKKMRAG